MKFFLLLLAVAAAAANLQLIDHKIEETENADVDISPLSSYALLLRYRRGGRRRVRATQAPPPEPFMKDSFMTKHVARREEMRFLDRERTRSTQWRIAIERFAKDKARDGYRKPDRPLRDVLPDSYSTIEMRNNEDFTTLRQDFQNRQGNDFITEHSYKVHQFRKKPDGIGTNYEYVKSDEFKLELGVDSNDKVNHFAGTVKCQNNGRNNRRRTGRSPVFRLGGRFCTRTWVNPMPPEPTTPRRDGNRGTGSSSGSTSQGGTQNRRPCRRGFRRVAGGRCQRIRRQRT